MNEDRNIRLNFLFLRQSYIIYLLGPIYIKWLPAIIQITRNALKHTFELELKTVYFKQTDEFAFTVMLEIDQI